MAGFLNGALNLDSYPVTTSSGDNNNVAISGSLVYVTVSNNNDAITGIVPEDATAGLLVFVVNIGPSNSLVIKNNSGSSSAGNKILTYSGSNVTVAPYQTALLGYDTTNGIWHVIQFA